MTFPLFGCNIVNVKGRVTSRRKENIYERN
nr:MAG TPA: hypothetical protein [Caudoviricetes sp.]